METGKDINLNTFSYKFIASYFYLGNPNCLVSLWRQNSMKFWKFHIHGKNCGNFFY